MMKMPVPLKKYIVTLIRYVLVEDLIRQLKVELHVQHSDNNMDSQLVINHVEIVL